MRSEVSIWVIYDHPKDYPQHYIARRFSLDKPTSDVIVSKDLEIIRTKLINWGLVCLSRHATDDPVIVESWI